VRSMERINILAENFGVWCRAADGHVMRPHAPPQLVPDYAMEVGHGGKRATVGTGRGLAMWPENLSEYVLPGSLKVPTRCASESLVSNHATKRTSMPNAGVKGTIIGTIMFPLIEWLGKSRCRKR
jgi:hypothetical protein